LTVPIRLLRSFVEQGFAAAGITARWTAEQYEAFASELAEEFTVSERMKEAVHDCLWDQRAILFADEALTHRDPQLTIRRTVEKPESELLQFVELDPRLKCVTEPISETTNRSLDYIEQVTRIHGDMRFFDLRRALTICDRVGQAMLGRYY
jgi:hypothetical protein